MVVEPRPLNFTARISGRRHLAANGIILDPVTSAAELMLKVPACLRQHRKLENKNRNDRGGDGKKPLREP